MDDFIDLSSLESADDEEYLIKAVESMPSEEIISRYEDEEYMYDAAKAENIPLDLFKSGREGLSVTDLVNQFWCEQQFEYSFSEPIAKPVPAVVSTGSIIHLERELEVHDIIPVVCKTKEDAWALKFLNCYQQLTILSQGTAIRELPIFGSLFKDDIFIQGIIDEIRCNTQGLIEIRELKTRSVRSFPRHRQHSKNVLQVSIYRKLLDDLLIKKRCLDVVKRHVLVDWESQLNQDLVSYAEELGLQCVTLEDTGRALSNFLAISNFPPFAQPVIEYCYQGDKETIGCRFCEYDEPGLKETILKQYEYLQGNRQATGVDIEDAWKCRSCDYSEICLWRKDQEIACQKKNASNFTIEFVS